MEEGQVVYLLPGHGALVQTTLPHITAPVFVGAEDIELVKSAHRSTLMFSAHPLTPGKNILICKIAGSEGPLNLDGVLCGRTEIVNQQTWAALKFMLVSGTNHCAMASFLQSVRINSDTNPTYK